MNSNMPLRDCQEAKYGRLEQQSSIFSLGIKNQAVLRQMARNKGKKVNYDERRNV